MAARKDTALSITSAAFAANWLMTPMMNTTKKIRPPIKCPEQKWHLKDFIISNFPEGYEQMTYVEPFCAGGAIFLNKNASTTEVICDSDQGIVALFKAIRDEPKEFITRIKRTKYSERAFKIALNKSQTEFEDYIDRAVNEYILRKMSRGGKKKAFAWSDKLADETANEWEAMTDKLSEISDRVQNTTVLCKNFVEVIKVWDEDNTLFYFDPPALRSIPIDESTEPHELSVEDHMNLIHLAKNAKGKVIISGFSCPLYNRSLKSWKCKKKTATASQTKSKHVDCIWTNY